MTGSGYGLMIFLAVMFSFGSFTLYDDLSITTLVYAHDGDGDGFDDDTLLPVVDDASNDPFPGSGEDFEADLTPDAITAAGGVTNSAGSGHVHLLWSENQERLQYEIELIGITVDTSAGSDSIEALTKIHIHQGSASDLGPHALNIFGGPAEDDAEMEIHLDDNEIHGIWGDIDIGSLTSDTARSRQLSDVREQLCAGELYFNIHTNWNPSGAIRGQIIPTSELCDFDLGKSEFSASLNASQVDAAGGVGKHGFTGTAEAHFDQIRDSLYYEITFSDNVDIFGDKTADTTDDLTALHLHYGPAGKNGDHLLNIFGASCMISLDPSFDAICDDAQMEINAVDNSISGVWDDADRDISHSDHLRSKNLSDHIGDLCNERTYFQAHFSDGNIRGQIHLDNHDLCDFDPNHSDFNAMIDESQIVGGTGSSATGIADLRFNSHYDALQYEIDLDGLDTDDIQTLENSLDDLTALHFHNAPAGTNGPVHLLNVFGIPEFSDDDYQLQPGSGLITGIWDDGDEGEIPNQNGRTKKLTASVDALCTNEVYINVHSTGFASGEIRGQILKTPDNIMCDFDLSKQADFTATLNECKLLRVTDPTLECPDDIYDDGGHDDGGHDDGGHGNSNQDPVSTVKMWFNDAKDALYYKIKFVGVDTTKEQTLDTTVDDLHKIHIHNGDEFSTGPHAFNIIEPFGDPDDLKINHGTRTVSGIWEVGDLSDTQTSTRLTDWYDELCTEELYVQIHNAEILMRGQIEVNGHNNNICEPPTLVSATAISNVKIILVFDKPVILGTLPFIDLEFPVGTDVSISNIDSSISPLGHGVVTLTLATALSGTETGLLTITDDLQDQIGNIFHSHDNPILIQNALGNVPLEITDQSSNVIVTDDFQASELFVPDGVDATLDLSSTITNPSVGKTKVTIPTKITTTVYEGTSDEVQVVFPHGLEVTGNSAGFNGILSLPTKSSCAASFGSNETVNSCVEIGVSGVELDLSSPAKIVLVGEAGNTAFFSTLDGIRTVIDYTCPGPDDPGTISNSGPMRECAISYDGNLIVFTTHLTSFGSFSSASSSGGGHGGGRGTISSQLAPNLILYNTCEENSNGMARIIAFSHDSRGEIKAQIHVDDVLIYADDVTEKISHSNYIESSSSSNYDYHIFDASLPSDADSFVVRISDLDDKKFSVLHLVEIPKNSCYGVDMPFPLKENATFIQPFEPLEIPHNLQTVDSTMIDPEPTTVDSTMSSKCGPGTSFIDGYCQVTLKTNNNVDSKNTENSLGIFEQFLKWLKMT